jgi:hypothetical protein
MGTLFDKWDLGPPLFKADATVLRRIPSEEVLT